MNRLLKTCGPSFRARSARNLLPLMLTCIAISSSPLLSYAEEDLIRWDEHHAVRQEKGKDIALYVGGQFKRAREARQAKRYLESWDAYVAIQKEIPEELISKEDTDVIPSATLVIPRAKPEESRSSQESARLIAWKEMRELLRYAQKNRRSKSAYRFLHTSLGAEPPEKPFKEAYAKATEDGEFSPYDGFQFSWLLAPYLPTKTGGLWVEKMGDAFVEQGNFLRAYASYKAIKDYSIAYNKRIGKKLSFVKERLDSHLNKIEKATALEGLGLTDGTVYRFVKEKRGMHKEKTPYLEITFVEGSDPFESIWQVIRKRIYDFFGLGYITSKKYDPLLIRYEDKIIVMSYLGSFFIFDLNGMLLEKKPVIHEFLFLDNDFTYIPKGTFKMGSPPGEEGRYDNEMLHTVRLTKDFYLQRTEVTQLQWYFVTGERPSYFRGEKCCKEDWDEELEICPNHPVEQVSRDDVQIFIQKLNEMQKTYVYRLPTEAEWEYAARVSGVSEEERRKFLTADGFLDIRESESANANYGFGNSEDRLEEYAWYYKNAHGQTHSVLDPWIKPIGGLYDMHGNVWEWVSDWYGKYPTGTVIDPGGPPTGSGRVIRGVNWYGYPQRLESAYRLGLLPDGRDVNVGCRLLRQ